MVAINILVYGGANLGHEPVNCMEIHVDSAIESNQGNGDNGYYSISAQDCSFNPHKTSVS